MKDFQNILKLMVEMPTPADGGESTPIPAPRGAPSIETIRGAETLTAAWEAYNSIFSSHTNTLNTDLSRQLVRLKRIEAQIGAFMGSDIVKYKSNLKPIPAKRARSTAPSAVQTYWQDKAGVDVFPPESGV